MSAPISAQEAKDMIEAYLAHPNPVPCPDAGSGTKLKGLRIDRTSLEAMLNPASGNPNDEVFLALAVRQEDLGKPTEEQFFTVVAMPIDANNDLQDGDAYDHFTSCPVNCPANYSTLFQ